MFRCPVCGCRLASHQPVCWAHGRQETPPPSEALVCAPQPTATGYVVQKQIGQGGFGAVYKAQRVSDGRTVALKFALAENAAARRSLEREIWGLRAVPPPAAPALLGQGRSAEGSPYLVLEYITAPTLATLMEETPGPWALDRAATIARPLLAAMASVHAAGVVHRDIKPENFFITGQGSQLRARVFDFGLAAPVGQVPSADAAREGTPEYMSPEQDAGALSVDRRADVYSLGVLLYEMLAGTLPFVGAAADLREGHRGRRPPLFAYRMGIPKPIEAFVLKALAKDPNRRFADAGEMLTSLQKLRRLWQLIPDQATRETTAYSGPPTGEMAAVATAKPAAEQRSMGLLYFKPSEGQAVGPAEAKRLGAELASASPALGLVLAFDYQSSDNPVRLAATAAQRVVEHGYAQQVLVDAYGVLVQVRPNGQRRFLSAAFSRKDKYPSEAWGDGVFITEAALELVPQLNASVVADTPGIRKLNAAQQRELTAVGGARHAFVGRDAELEQLFASACVTAARSSPTIATVVGEAGLGKSELAGALAAGLATKLPAANVFAFHCQEGLEGGQSRTVAELLRWALKAPREAPPDNGRSLLSERLGLAAGDGSWAATALALGWATLELPELKDVLTAPGALRAAMAKSIGEALRRASCQGPVIVVADDAHLADEILLDGFEYAALKEGVAPVWICVLTRPTLLVGRPLLGARAANNPKLELAPLRREDAILLARILLHPVANIPASAVNKLVGRTRGNPLLLVELVRGLKRDGAIKQSSKGEYRLAVEAIDQLPDSPVVQWLATREIEALPRDLAAHARLAALLGSDLLEAEMEGVIALSEELDVPTVETLLDAGVGLRRLVEAGILVSHRSGRLSFRYGVLRDATYAMVPEAQRKSVHALAYQYYDRLADEEALPHLAFHSARAGLRDEARQHYVRLADRARQRHAYLEAANLYAQARGQVAAGQSLHLMPIALSHGLMQFRLGLYDQALEALAEARALAQQLHDRASEFEAVVEMATAMDFLHHYEQSRKYSEEAAALTTGMRDPLAQARIEFARGRSLYRFSQVVEAVPKMLGAARAAEALGDVAYETQVDAWQMAGAGLAALGKLDEALEIFDKLLVLCNKHQDPLHETATLGNRAHVWLPRGNFAQLRQEYERALMLARENCFSTVETNLIHNLAEVSLLTGDLEAADSYAAQNVELSDRTSGQSEYPALLMLLLRGRAKVAGGDEPAARGFLTEIDRRLQAAQGSAHAVEFMPSDDVLKTAVDLATRDAHEEEWERLLARSKEVSVQLEPIEILAMRGRAAARRGNHLAGQRWLKEALEVARSMPNPLIPQLELWLQSIPG